jgi:hypothetical protein
MVYYKLDNVNIRDDYFWMKVVGDMKYHLSSQTNLNNKILIVKIQEISSDDTTMIPKLEFKNT